VIEFHFQAKETFFRYYHILFPPESQVEEDSDFLFIV
jgi:hypothetical protein